MGDPIIQSRHVDPATAGVPVEMRESYVKDGERISGHVVCGKFRLLKR